MRTLEFAFVQSHVTSVPFDGRLERISALFNEDRGSARMAATQFELDLDPAYLFFLTRNRLPATRFFYELFRSLAFLDAMPDVGMLRWSPSTLNDAWEARMIGQGQGLKLVDGWDALSTLAGWIRRGAIHRDAEARATCARCPVPAGGR